MLICAWRCSGPKNSASSASESCRSDLLVLPSASGCPPDALWLWQASLLSSLRFKECSAPESKMAVEWVICQWQLESPRLAQQSQVHSCLFNASSTVQLHPARIKLWEAPGQSDRCNGATIVIRADSKSWRCTISGAMARSTHCGHIASCTGSPDIVPGALRGQPCWETNRA